MAVISKSLEATIKAAGELARKREHSHATLEHLLLALMDESSAREALEGAGGDSKKLVGVVTNFLDSELGPQVKKGSEVELSPSFKRVLERATIFATYSGKKEVSGSGMLVSMMSERESHAVFFLQEQHVSRYDLFQFILHGLRKDSSPKMSP